MKQIYTVIGLCSIIVAFKKSHRFLKYMHAVVTFKHTFERDIRGKLLSYNLLVLVSLLWSPGWHPCPPPSNENQTIDDFQYSKSNLQYQMIYWRLVIVGSAILRQFRLPCIFVRCILILKIVKTSRLLILQRVYLST